MEFAWGFSDWVVCARVIFQRLFYRLLRLTVIDCIPQEE